MNSGKVFRINPVTGAATQVDLGGGKLDSADALHLEGHSLYVAENAVNAIVEYTMNNSGTHAELVATVTNPRLDGPSDIAPFGNRFYLANSRENTVRPTPTTKYNIVAIDKP